MESTVPIVVAFVASAPGLIAALAALRRHERTQQSLSEKIGSPNGQGNVVQMLETVLGLQRTTDRRLLNLEERVVGIETKVTSGAQLDRADARLDRAEEIRVARRERP